MSTTLRHYARALYEITRDQDKAAAKKSVDRTFELLQSKGLGAKGAELLAEVERLDNEAQGRITATLRSAHRLDEEVVEKIEKMIRQRSGAKEVVLDKVIDKDVLGGIIVSYGDTILDMSLATTVDQLVEEIKN